MRFEDLETLELVYALYILNSNANLRVGHKVFFFGNITVDLLSHWIEIPNNLIRMIHRFICS